MHQRPSKFLCCLDSSLSRRHRRHPLVVRQKFNRSCNAFAPRLCYKTSVAPVVFRGVPQIPSFRAVRAPSLPDGGWFVHQDFCSRRSQRVSVEIECTVEGLVSRETRVKPRRPQQVESDHGLRDQSIPKVHREVRIARRQSCNQVRLERLDRAFGSVRSVQVWGHQCERNALLLKVRYESLWALIIQELYLGCEPALRKMRVKSDLLRD